MKRGLVLLTLGLFLMVFIIEEVNADNWFSNKNNIAQRLNITDYNMSIDTHVEADLTNIKANNTYISLTVQELDFSNYLDDGSIYMSIKPNVGSINGVTLTINGKEYDSLLYDQHGVNLISDVNNLTFDGRFYSDIFLISDDGSTFVGRLSFYFDKLNGNQKWVMVTGLINQDNENRISSLESWKQTISETITNLIATLTGHTTKIDNQEVRISTLENKIPITNSSTIPNYFKYLNSGTRKSMVCGYAQDNHLTTINDLGFNCNITYTSLRNGGEKAYCKCSGK